MFDYLRDDLKIEFGFTDIYLRIVDLSKKEAELMGLKEGDASFTFRKYLSLTQW